MTDKLTVYNKALTHLEERRLVDLNEKREPKRVLDSLYPDVAAYCLAQALWGFAKRSVQIDATPNVNPAFGYNYAFPVPSDWVRTGIVSTSPQLDPPLLQYIQESGYWWANATPLFVSYVSNDPSYGMDLSRWPAPFTEYVGYRLARQACGRLPGKDALTADLEKNEQKEKRNAKGLDAMDRAPGLPPVPYLVRARRGAFGPGGLFFGSSNSGDN